MLDDCMTNERCEGHARAQIIADAAHCRGMATIPGGKPEVIRLLPVSRHPLRIAGKDKAASGRQSADDALAGANSELREAYSYGGGAG
jgi:hypothetical protein